MGRCTPADCSRRASSRRWHFLGRKKRGLQATRRVGIPEKRSQWGLAKFPGSGARLSCHQRSNRDSGLPVQYCSESGELIGLSGRTPDYFQHCAILNSPGGPLRRNFRATMGMGVVQWAPVLSLRVARRWVGTYPSRNPYTPPRHFFCPQCRLWWSTEEACIEPADPSHRALTKASLLPEQPSAPE